MEQQTGAAPWQPEPRKGWFARNWKWFIPSGCLTLLVLLFALIAGIVSIVEMSIKSSGAYTQALAQVEAAPVVSSTIGLPLKQGWFVSGSINTSGDAGEADISFSVSGPKGSGKIYAVSKEAAGVWHSETLQLQPDGQADRIDLLQGQPIN
jgi:hypothetical protein